MKQKSSVHFFAFSLILISTALTSTGAHAFRRLSALPSSLYFGQTHVGNTTFAQYSDITNMGDEPVDNIWVNPMGDRGQFDVYDNCYQTLYPGDRCQVRVRYTPWVAGSHYLTIRIGNGMTSIDVDARGSAFQPH